MLFQPVEDELGQPTPEAHLEGPQLDRRTGVLTAVTIVEGLDIGHEIAL